MQSKVEELWARVADDRGGSHGDQAVVLATLGLFLSFIHFAAAGVDPSNRCTALPMVKSCVLGFD
jgi:hypothetical protein